MIFRLLSSKFSNFIYIIIFLTILYLRSNNQKLQDQKIALTYQIEQKNKIITKQKKVIYIVKKIKDTNLLTNIKRMQDGQL